MNTIKHFNTEEGSVSLSMLTTMHPAIVVMISWTNLWCYSQGITPFWTSWQRTSAHNKKLGATDVHLWRAADLSLSDDWGWNQTLRTKYEKRFRKTFKQWGAITNDTGKNLVRRPIVRHDSGHGDHFHLQCAPHVDIDFRLDI